MPASIDDSTGSVFHAGEIALQRELGLADRLEEIGRRMIQRELPDQHRAFYPHLPFIIAGSVDRADDAWATLVAGEPGFMHSPQADRLVISASIDPRDPAAGGFAPGLPVGLLGIELETRRRNRLNGIIGSDRGDHYEVRVRQAYGNCPQFIRLRDHRFDRSPSLPSQDDATHLGALDAEAIALIRSADTFFVASYADVAGERQVDVSHRGGMPGFVEVTANGVLTIPDYRGNRHFNTLGNILTNPRAGLLFIDFETGELLQLTGDAAIDSDADAASQRTGAERLWTFHPRRIVRRKNGSPLRWIAQENGHSRSSLATLPDHDQMQPKG